MDQRHSEVWATLLSGAPMTVRSALASWIDLQDPPDLFEFVVQQWNLRQDGAPGCWDLLMNDHFLVRAVALPLLLNLDRAVTVARLACEADGLFDSKLVRRLAAAIEAVAAPTPEVMRILEVMEHLSSAQRFTMTLLGLVNTAHPHVQSKLAKLLGRCAGNANIVEALFQSPDRRVRANLLEGIGRRDSIAGFLPLIERAARDQHPRVSSMALAIAARHGNPAAAAIIRIRRQSKLDPYRQAAEYAANLSQSAVARQSDESSVLAGRFEAQPAILTAVGEIHSQADRHPDEQP